MKSFHQGLYSCSVFVAAMVASLSVGAADEPAAIAARRLSPAQYAATIADLFGTTIKIGGRFDPGLRVDGLIEIGASKANISSAGIEQYDTIARSIAAQVMDEKRRDLFVQCKPAAANAADTSCSTKFFKEIGPHLFRRPLTEAELRTYVVSADEAARTLRDFYAGLGLSMASMLTAPQFLFRQETTKVDPAHPGSIQLDPFAIATRLSYFLWNSTPDRALLDAAASGKLDSSKGRANQVERMIKSPRLEAGVRAFFWDMLRYEDFGGVTKDNTIYPKFSTQVAQDAQEQTLRTIVDLVLTQRSDYREIFTTKKTFLTRALASVYEVPFAVNAPSGSIDQWRPYQFADNDPRGGIAMQAAFITLNSHPGRSSPTLRGKALREVFFCQKVPDPPGNVQFDLIQDTSNPLYKTARQRLGAHATSPACAGCHKITDPIGFALENFDGGGSFRSTENGMKIDTTGLLDGKAFANGLELGSVVRSNPAATSCIVTRMTSYALGRESRSVDPKWKEALNKDFANDKFVLPDLMSRIALSPQFYEAADTK